MEEAEDKSDKSKDESDELDATAEDGPDQDPINGEANEVS
jgi:hypothetical protein